MLRLGRYSFCLIKAGVKNYVRLNSNKMMVIEYHRDLDLISWTITTNFPKERLWDWVSIAEHLGILTFIAGMFYIVALILITAWNLGIIQFNIDIARFGIF